MKVVITGGFGFIGTLLAQRLLQKKTLSNQEGVQTPINKLVIFDVFKSENDITKDPRVEVVIGDVSDPVVVEKALSTDEDLAVFHLSSIMSGQGEEDFDLAMRVNLHGCLLLLETCRKRKRKARFVFTSATAVFDSRELVTDETRLLPQSTYGTTKACCELLICDYSRRGFVDGRMARLPTVIVRPGAPNKAASSFCSELFRSPINGIDCKIPVGPDSKVFVIGYKTVIECLTQLHELEESKFGYDRTTILPGFRVTVQEMVDSLHRVAKELLPGTRRLGNITFELDSTIEKIVNGWPTLGVSENSKKLGLVGNNDLDDIVKNYILDFVLKK